MVAQGKILTRWGIYLARLGPVKATEVGKIRPVVILTSQTILVHKGYCSRLGNIQPFLLLILDS
jgi:hypothetical protein